MLQLVVLYTLKSNTKYNGFVKCDVTSLSLSAVNKALSTSLVTSTVRNQRDQVNDESVAKSGLRRERVFGGPLKVSET